MVQNLGNQIWVSTPQNRTIGVNLADFWQRFINRCHPSGIQEGFWVYTVCVSDPVRLGMQIAFGRVRRKTEPTGPGGTLN